MKRSPSCVLQDGDFCLRVFTVSHGIFALPIPGIPNHIVQILLGLPTQHLFALGGISIAGCNVTRATLYDLVGQISSVGSVECFHHIQNGATLAGTQIEHFAACVLHDIFYSGHMTLC